MALPLSPLSISRISVSQPSSYEAEFAPKQTPYHESLQPNPIPILIRIKKAPMLTVMAIGVVGVSGSMYVLSKGITLSSHRNWSMTADDQSSLVQDYNALAGGLVALLIKPLEVLIGFVLPVALVCLATDLGLHNGSTKSRMIIAMLNMMLLWILSVGFTSLNIQLEQRDTTRVLEDDDLRGLTANISAGKSANSTNELASFNTILHNALMSPQPRRIPGSCTRPSPRRIPVSVEYGFKINNWLPYMVATAPSATAKLHMNLSELGSSPVNTFPMALGAARDVFTYGLRLTDTFFRDAASSANLSNFKLEDIDGIEAKTQSDEAAIASLLKSMKQATSRVMALPSSPYSDVDVNETSIEFSHFELASGIMFEAVTLSVPLVKDYLSRQIALVNDTTARVWYPKSTNDSVEFQINTKEECGSTGCIISPRNRMATDSGVDFSSQVRALAICRDKATGADNLEETLSDDATACAEPSNSSLLVFSVGKKIVGEEIAVQLNDTAGVVTLKNARKMFSVTVGRLSWKTTDLAKQFGATCGASGSCDGLRFPLDFDAGHVVVGAKFLPLAKLLKYSSVSAMWPSLALASADEIDMNYTLKGDVIFPRNFNRSSGWKGIEGRYCEVERGHLLDMIDSNHLYSEESLQPAYTSALFWLFQNGVVRELSHPPVRSTFLTHSSWTDIVLKVPQQTAVLTYVGCGIVVVLSALVTVCGKSREASIERRFTAAHLASMLSDHPRLPKTLFQCDLLQLEGDHIGNSERLNDFEVAGLLLRHRSKRSIVVSVPKPASLVSSSSSSSSSSYPI